MEVASWSFWRILEEEVITKLKTSRVEWNLEFIRWQNFDLDEVSVSSFDALRFSPLVSEATKEELSMNFGDEDSSNDKWLGVKRKDSEN